MTLVVTTASARGITVVGDRAETQGPGEVKLVIPNSTKIFYSATANVSFALWGDAQWPNDLDPYNEWFRKSIVDALSKGTSLERAAEIVCEGINPILGRLGKDYNSLRRGIHVAGFVDFVPRIYHVHTGDPLPAQQHELRLHRDYPDIHVKASSEQQRMAGYRQMLREGPLPQLRNGRYDAMGVVLRSIDGVVRTFEEVFDVKVPAPSLEAQLAYDAAIVSLTAGMMIAAGRAPTVSFAVDGFAFDEDGLKIESLRHASATGEPLPSRTTWHSSDIHPSAGPGIVFGDLDKIKFEP